MAAIDELEAAVANESTVEASVESLITELVGMIHALPAPGTDPATAARISALVQTITSRTSNLAAAVVAGTDVLPTVTTTAAPVVTDPPVTDPPVTTDAPPTTVAPV